MAFSEDQEQQLLAVLSNMERRPHGQVVRTSHGIFEEVSADREGQYNGLLNRAMVGSLLNAGLTPNGSGLLQRSPTIPRETIETIMKSPITRAEPYGGNNTGFVGYILEDGAKFIIPQLTPFLNMTPRVAMPGIDTVNYRTVLDYFGGTGPSVGAGVVDQGGTPNQLSYQFKNLNYTAKMIGTSDIVPFETQIYGRSFQGDVLATASAKLIPAIKQIEEMWLINSSANLWNPQQFLLSTATTGGTVLAGTYWFILTAVNAHGQSLGSQVASIVTTGTTSTITLTIFAVPGAASYNVYCGAGTSQPATSAMWLQSAITQFGGGSALNQPATSLIKQGYFNATMTAAPATTGTALASVTANTAVQFPSVASSNTGAPLTFDGALALLFNNAGAAGALGNLAETPLVATPASAAGTLANTDIDTLHSNMFLSSHADPDYGFVNVLDHKKVSYLVANGSNARIMLDASNADAQGHLVAGYRATAYINQTTGKVIPLVTLPYLGQGTIMFGTYTLPFQVQDIAEQPFHVGYNRDMWSQLYPPDQSHPTQTMIAAYLNECLVNQCLGFWSAITGITLT